MAYTGRYLSAVHFCIYGSVYVSQFSGAFNAKQLWQAAQRGCPVWVMGRLGFLLPCVVPQYLVMLYTVHVWTEMVNEDCNILSFLKTEYFWKLMI